MPLSDSTDQRLIDLETKLSFQEDLLDQLNLIFNPLRFRARGSIGSTKSSSVPPAKSVQA